MLNIMWISASFFFSPPRVNAKTFEDGSSHPGENRSHP